MDDASRKLAAPPVYKPTQPKLNAPPTYRPNQPVNSVMRLETPPNRPGKPPVFGQHSQWIQPKTHFPAAGTRRITINRSALISPNARFAGRMGPAHQTGSFKNTIQAKSERFLFGNNGQDVTITFDIETEKLEGQIHGPSLTAGFRAKVNNFSVEPGDLAGLSVGWIQTAKSTRIVRIVPPGGKGREWMYTESLFKDGNGPAFWYSTPRTFGQPVLSGLAGFKQRLAQASLTFSDDPNFVWLDDQQEEWLKAQGLTQTPGDVPAFVNGEGNKASITTRGLDEFTAWFAAYDSEANRLRYLERICWGINWRADLTEKKFLGSVIQLGLAGEARHSTASRSSTTMIINLL